MDGTEAAQLAVRTGVCLNGQYACVMDGKAVHPPIHAEVRLMEAASGAAEEALQQAEAFLAD